jgi:hypothetical protein
MKAIHWFSYSQKLLPAFVFFLIAFPLVLASCSSSAPVYTPAPVLPPSDSAPASTISATTTPSILAESPPLTIALDYFGIRNTHWLSQMGGDQLAKIQLIAVVSDEKGTLAIWPPQNIPNLTFDMDYFQVEALKERMNPPVIFNGSATGTLVVYIAAYNVDKGAITKAQIDIISKWLGLPDLNRLKDVVPDRELVGYYWQACSA